MCFLLGDEQNVVVVVVVVLTWALLPKDQYLTYDLYSIYTRAFTQERE